MAVVNLKLKPIMVEKLQILLADNLRNEKVLFQKNNSIKSLENIKELEKLLTAIEVNTYYQKGEINDN